MTGQNRFHEFFDVTQSLMGTTTPCTFLKKDFTVFFCFFFLILALHEFLIHARENVLFVETLSNLVLPHLGFIAGIRSFKNRFLKSPATKFTHSPCLISVVTVNNNFIKEETKDFYLVCVCEISSLCRRGYSQHILNPVDEMALSILLA